MGVVVWYATFSLNLVYLGGCIGGWFLCEVPKHMYVIIASLVLNAKLLNEMKHACPL